MKTAVLVDGAFFLKRHRYVFPKAHVGDFAKVADDIWHHALRHLGDHPQDLYRIFYYDCPPLTKRVHYPISKLSLDFSKTPESVFRLGLFDALKRKRKVALRLGELKDGNGWILRPVVAAEMLKGTRNWNTLSDTDFAYDIRQKEVDAKIGIDIASLAYKQQVEQIVLIAGDGDFVPAAKLARREGIDFILDPLRATISPTLFEHIDGLNCPLSMKKKNK